MQGEKWGEVDADPFKYYLKGNDFGGRMIKSFKCKQTEMLFDDLSVRPFRAFERPARRMLLMLHAAIQLDDLLIPPGNRLEALRGNREGQHSIRINGQWRICFVWRDNHAHEVEIVDYH